MRRAGTMPIAAPCAIVSAVAWMLLHVLMRRGETPASLNHFITVLCRRAGGGGTMSWYCSRSAGVKVRRGSVSDVLANHPNTLLPSGSCETCGATVGSLTTATSSAWSLRRALTTPVSPTNTFVRIAGYCCSMRFSSSGRQMNANVSLTPRRSVPFSGSRVRKRSTSSPAVASMRSAYSMQRVTFGREAHPRAADARTAAYCSAASSSRMRCDTRRLRQLELERGGVEAAEPHDALECTKLAQRHVHDRSILSNSCKKISFFKS